MVVIGYEADFVTLRVGSYGYHQVRVPVVPAGAHVEHLTSKRRVLKTVNVCCGHYKQEW